MNTCDYFEYRRKMGLNICPCCGAAFERSLKLRDHFRHRYTSKEHRWFVHFFWQRYTHRKRKNISLPYKNEVIHIDERRAAAWLKGLYGDHINEPFHGVTIENG